MQSYLGPAQRGPARQQWRVQLIALRISVIYAIVGSLWIFTTDSVLQLLVGPELVIRFSMLKGLFYVIATSALLYYLVSRNVSVIQASRDAVSDGERRLAAIIETVPSGIIVAGADGRFILANAATEIILGLRRADLIGRHYEDPGWQMMTLDHAPVSKEDMPFGIVEATGIPVYGLEFVVIRPDGSRVMVSANAAPLRDQEGRIIGSVASISDITERKHAEEERRQRDEHDRQVRDEAEEAKRQFYQRTIYAVTDGRLNLVSHEEIESVLARCGSEMPIDSPEDLSRLREAVASECKLAGMPEDRCQSLLIAVNEAAANAVKHAGGGVGCVGRGDGRVQVSVRDEGPGMDSLILPKVALVKGFSTKPSLGLGYMLILESVDSVYLASDPSGTWLLLEQKVLRPMEEATLDMILSRLPDSW